MAFRDLRAALEWLERTGRLVDVDSELSPRHEIGAFLAVASKRERRAYRFGKVAGYAGPIVALVRIHSGLRSIGVCALRASRRIIRRPCGATVTLGS